MGFVSKNFGDFYFLNFLWEIKISKENIQKKKKKKKNLNHQTFSDYIYIYMPTRQQRERFFTKTVRNSSEFCIKSVEISRQI